MTDSEPFLWLPSAVWFGFLAGRLETLADHQIQLYQRNTPAPNYTVMTGLFTYMMQSVLFTPHMVNPHVRESLALLNYKASVDRFGMFFLQELDMTREIVLPEVLVEDDIGMLRALGYLERPIRRSRDTPRVYQEYNEDDYPIGKTPSWSQLTEMLRLQPWVMMRGWSWPEELDHYRDAELGSMAHLASELFRLFTSQVWVTLNDHWKKEPDHLDRLMTLVESLELWTLEKLHDKLPSYRVIPCNSDIHGSIPGPKALSFSMRYGLYFVQTGDPLKRIWDILGHAPGYIASYRKEIEMLDVADVDELHGGLEMLFSHCQCLPNSKRDGGSVLWEVRQGEVILLGNPRFYKVDSIGDVGQKRQTRRAPTHTGGVGIQTNLLRLTGLSKSEASRTLRYAATLSRHSAKNKKSGRRNNRRVPPTRHKKKPVHDSDKEDSEEEESQEVVKDYGGLGTDDLEVNSGGDSGGDSGVDSGNNRGDSGEDLEDDEPSDISLYDSEED